MSKPAASVDVSGFHGDGNMYTTAEDLAQWLRALRGTAMAKPSTIAEMFVPGLGNGVVATDGYAYGWIVGTRFGKTMNYHTGFLPGFASRIERYPETGVTVIVLGNLDNARTSRIARDLAAAAHGLPYDVPRSHRIMKFDSTRLQPFVGKYRLANGTIATVSVGKSFLELEVPNRFTAGLLQENESSFYVPFFEGTVTFDRDASGRVTSLTMHYDGVDQTGQRQ
jgi:CubicO group peptidase (beta-lactamase class C family)